MSGPKTSRYTLTAEQRRLLEVQRKIEQRKAVAKEKIKQKSTQIAKLSGLFADKKQAAKELKARTGSDCGFSEKYKEFEKIIASAKALSSESSSDNPDKLEGVVASYDNAIKDAGELIRELESIASDNDIVLHSRLDEEIAGGFSASFAGIERNIKAVIEQQVNVGEIRQRIKFHISQIKGNSVLPEELNLELTEVQKRMNEIDDPVFLKNYAAVSVTPLLKRCRQAIDEYEKHHAEFEALYAEYHALCETYYFIPQAYACTEDSIHALKKEIERISHLAAEDEEECYISECLDEVMAEMGYSVIGSREVSKKNGVHFHSELYTYGEGTAVNVTFSSNGRIAMELGGIDSSDRLPDEHETAALCDAMSDFCSDFKEIEKRLAAKGVVVGDRISILPPNPEYAQIINTSDYDVQSQTDEVSKKKQRRKPAKPKAKRKE